MAARTGTPTTSAWRSPESGTAASTRSAVRAPDLVGDAGAGVGFVDHHRNAPAPQRPAARGQVGRQRDVAAEADHHVGVRRRRAPRGSPGSARRTRDGSRSQVAVGFARQRHRRDEFEVVAAFGDQPGLQAARGAQRGDPDPRIQRGQRVGDRHRGFDMAGGAATGENDRERSAVARLSPGSLRSCPPAGCVTEESFTRNADLPMLAAALCWRAARRVPCGGRLHDALARRRRSLFAVSACRAACRGRPALRGGSCRLLRRGVGRLGGCRPGWCAAGRATPRRGSARTARAAAAAAAGSSGHRGRPAARPPPRVRGGPRWPSRRS